MSRTRHFLVPCSSLHLLLVLHSLSPLEWNANFASWHPRKAKALVWLLKVGVILRTLKVVLQICVRSHTAHLMELLCNQWSKYRGKQPTGCLGSFVVCRTALVSSKHLIKTYANCVWAQYLGQETYYWEAQVNPLEALIFWHQYQWSNRANSYHFVLCSEKFLNHNSAKPLSPQETTPLSSKRTTLQRSSAFSNQKSASAFQSLFGKDRRVALLCRLQSALQPHLGGQA